MADKKISQLTTLAQADVAVTADFLPIVDTSATETKKATPQALVQAGATGATLEPAALSISGGTANGVAYLNGSKALTSGTTLAFDGTNFSIGAPWTTNPLRNSQPAFYQYSSGTTLATFVGETGASLGIFRVQNAAASGQLQLGKSRGTWASPLAVQSGDPMGDLAFVGFGGTNSRTLGRIVCSVDTYTSDTDISSFIDFRTSSSGSASATEKMRLTAAGDLGIGTASPGYKLDTNNTSAGTIARFVNGAGRGFVRIDGYDDMTLQFYRRGSSVGFIQTDSSGTELYAGTTGAYPLVFYTNNSERGRFTAAGDFLVGKTTAGNAATAGCELGTYGAILTRVSGDALLVNRQTNDGTIISIRQDNVEEGTISVSGNTVSYNAFAGSHWSQLQDGSKPDILRGTVMESINELCVWPDEQNERLPKSKVSDTAGSKKVYGVFMAWDNDWATTNDMYITAVGAFICRVNGSVTVQEGDLLESNGDGTARVQADDIIRSSTIGKVTSTVKTHQYDDGSYCVPTVLYCG